METTPTRSGLPQLGDVFIRSVASELEERKIRMNSVEGRNYVFEKAAEIRDLKPTAIEDSMVVDGELMPFIDPSSPLDFWARAEKMGFYESCNGVLTWVNNKGLVCIASATRKNTDILIAAGYVPGTTYDVIHNGQHFPNPALQTQWEGIKERGAELRRFEFEAAKRTDELKAIAEQGTKAAVEQTLP